MVIRRDGGRAFDKMTKASAMKVRMRPMGLGFRVLGF